MKKKLISMTILGFLTTSLVGCGQDIVKSNATSGVSNRFIDTGDSYKMGYTYNVFYDSKTNIVYLVGCGVYASGVTVMYDKEGKPMTLDEYNKTK